MDRPQTVLVTGGSGFIGTQLCQKLIERKYRVIIVDRQTPRFTHQQVQFIKLDISTEPLPAELDGTLDAIIHLAGQPIFGRWTPKYKQQIYDSRIKSTQLIVDSLKDWKQPPRTLISASAIGYYGDGGEAVLPEDSPAGSDFLAHVCVDWENASRAAEALGIRTVQLRTAHVVGNGGLLEPLMTPFRFGLGAWLGKGSEWFPWVHISDIIGLYLFALEHEQVSGPLNTAAPETIRQKDFMKAVGAAMHRKVLFSIPLWVIRLRYGGLADAFGNSAKINSERAQSLGYVFQHESLSKALSDTLH